MVDQGTRAEFFRVLFASNELNFHLHSLLFLWMRKKKRKLLVKIICAIFNDNILNMDNLNYF